MTVIFKKIQYNIHCHLQVNVSFCPTPLLPSWSVIHLSSLSLRAKPAGRWLDLIIQPLQWVDCEDIINGTEEGDAVQECSPYNGPDYFSSEENPK